MLHVVRFCPTGWFVAVAEPESAISSCKYDSLLSAEKSLFAAEIERPALVIEPDGNRARLAGESLHRFYRNRYVAAFDSAVSGTAGERIRRDENPDGRSAAADDATALASV